MKTVTDLSLRPPQLEEQPVDARGLAPEELDAFVISMVQVDGKWVCVSRYGDASWRLLSNTTNTHRAKLVFEYRTVPIGFRDALKAMIYRYLRRGLEGVVRPGPKSLRKFFDQSLPFLRFLEEQGIKRLADVTESLCKQYVEVSMRVPARRKGSTIGRPLAAGTLRLRFQAVEKIHELSQFCEDAMPTHPWPGSTPSKLAGVATGFRYSATTTLIPDEIFVRLFQAAWSDIEKGETVLRLRDELADVERPWIGLRDDAIRRYKNRHLEQAGWEGGLTALNDACLDLRTACYLVLASVSGCRNHELAFLQTDACRSSEGSDGEIYWWMSSRSTKTDEGVTEWMIPESGVTALRLMDRWAKPHQTLVRDEIANRRVADALDPEIAEASQHLNAIFLGAPANRTDRARTMCASYWNASINLYAQKHGIEWTFASHQFRRKFANYAARSQFGDLRYLKEHFKHWSMDMTLGYALNDSQEMALYLEIQEELDDIKEGIVHDWLHPTVPLAGGYGANIVAWRGTNEVSIFKDRKSMVIAVAESTAIRSNGHAWCTADDDMCVGNDMERTRCTRCDNSVIGRVHAHIYQGMYDRLKETLRCRDIGEGGLHRVRRDLARCRETLMSLGYDPEPATQ